MSRALVIWSWLVALVLACAGRAVLPANNDVSWLVTVAEKVVDGARLYVDVFELNPPMSVWMYIPAVVAGRALQIAPERALDLLLLALSAGVAVWTLRLAPQAILPAGARRDAAAPAIFAVLTIAPATSFGQREHVALILLLPWLALTLRRAHALPTPFAPAVLAGLCGGLMMTIKPHFALALFLASLAATLHARNWRAMVTIENVVAGLAVVAYSAILYFAFPTYRTQSAPIVALYLAVRTPLREMLFGAFPVFALELFAAAGLIVWTRRRSATTPWIIAPAGAIAGLLLAAIVQGKGWPYHFFPALGLLVLLLGALAADRSQDRTRSLLWGIFAAAVLVQTWVWNTIGIDMAAIQRPLAEIMPRPRIMALASDPGVAFPATRAVKGVWVDQAFIGWVPYFAAGLAGADDFDPAKLPALQETVAAQRRALVDDLRNRHPDVLLVQRKPFDLLAWAQRDKEAADLLNCFHQRDSVTIGDPEPTGGGLTVDIWAHTATGGCAPAP